LDLRSTHNIIGLGFLKNWPKCNHYICDYMWLLVICDYIWTFLQLFLVLVIFTTTLQLICNYFGVHPSMWTTFSLVFIQEKQFVSHYVMTLALGSQPRQRHGKVQAKNATRESDLHPQECEGMNSNSQVDSHFGSWNLYGVLNLQKGISGVKFIRLKSSLYLWKAFET
jgi:hypothetical protein